MHDSRLRMASLWPLGLKVVFRLLHLWLSLVTFTVVQSITFMGKFITYVVDGFITFVINFFYIYGTYYIYYQSLLHLC